MLNEAKNQLSLGYLITLFINYAQFTADFITLLKLAHRAPELSHSHTPAKKKESDSNRLNAHKTMAFIIERLFELILCHKVFIVYFHGRRICFGVNGYYQKYLKVIRHAVVSATLPPNRMCFVLFAFNFCMYAIKLVT